MGLSFDVHKMYHHRASRGLPLWRESPLLALMDLDRFGMDKRVELLDEVNFFFTGLSYSSLVESLLFINHSDIRE